MRRVLLCVLACLSLGVCFAIEPPAPLSKPIQELTNDEIDTRIQELQEKSKIYERNARVADRRANDVQSRDMSAYRQSLAARDRFKLYADKTNDEIQQLQKEKAKRAAPKETPKS